MKHRLVIEKLTGIEIAMSSPRHLIVQFHPYRPWNDHHWKAENDQRIGLC